jgi:hypothetical protein
MQHSRYGLTLQDITELLRFQGGLCPVCLLPLTERSDVDHDHNVATRGNGFTQAQRRASVRGLTHGYCNRWLDLVERFPHLRSPHVQQYLNYPPWQQVLAGAYQSDYDYRMHRRPALGTGRNIRLFTQKEAEVIREWRGTLTAAEVAREFGCDRALINMIYRERTYRSGR